MRKWSKETIVLLVWAGVFLLVVPVGYNFLYRPKMTSLKELRWELKELAANPGQVIQKEAELEGLKKEIDQLKQNLLGWQAKISSRRSTSQILGDLSSAAGEAGIRTIDFKTRSPKDFQGLFSGVPVAVNLTANYSQLGEFLKKLNQLPGLITVEKLLIQREPKFLPASRVELTLTSYYIK